jgi:hypothetical protein
MIIAAAIVHTMNYNIQLFYMNNKEQSDRLSKQYNDIKMKYMFKIGIKIQYIKPKVPAQIEFKRSDPIPIPVPSSDDDL